MQSLIGRLASRYYCYFKSIIHHSQQKSQQLAGFFNDISLPYASITVALVSGRSTNSTKAIGALSPLRKPHFKIRK